MRNALHPRTRHEVIQSDQTTQRRFETYEVPSDYMVPTLYPGDLVEIDRTATRIDREGIYLLAFPSGAPSLRRISFGPRTDRVRVSCDRAPQQTLEECAPSFLRVLGRATRSIHIRTL